MGRCRQLAQSPRRPRRVVQPCPRPPCYTGLRCCFYAACVRCSNSSSSALPKKHRPIRAAVGTLTMSLLRSLKAVARGGQGTPGVRILGMTYVISSVLCLFPCQKLPRSHYASAPLVSASVGACCEVSAVKTFWGYYCLFYQPENQQSKVQ